MRNLTYRNHNLISTLAERERESKSLKCVVIVLAALLAASGILLFTNLNQSRAVADASASLSATQINVVASTSGYNESSTTAELDRVVYHVDDPVIVTWKGQAVGNDFVIPASIKVDGVTVKEINELTKVDEVQTSNTEYERIMGSQGTMTEYENLKNYLESDHDVYLGTFTKDSTVEVEYIRVSPVYRMYNTITSEHLFSTNKTEYDTWVEKCKANQDYWIGEGIDWLAPYTETGTKTVHRLYNPALGAMGHSSHYYTADEAEMSNLINVYGWQDDGVDNQFKSGSGTGSGNGTAIYTCYNELLGSAHHYTSSSVEWEGLAAHMWNLERDKNGTNGVFQCTLATSWSFENNYYTVEHQLEGVDGTYTTSTKEVKAGTVGQATQAKANSYRGYTVKNFSQTSISGDNKTSVVIQYERNDYDLTFNSGDKGVSSTLTMTYGAAVAEPNAVSVKGWDHGGWYYDQAFQHKVDFNSLKMPAGNMTLYAQWTENALHETDQRKVTDENGIASPINPVTNQVQKTAVTEADGTPIPRAIVEIDKEGITTVVLPTGYEGTDVVVTITDTNDQPIGDLDTEVWNNGGMNYRDKGETDDYGIFKSTVTERAVDPTTGIAYPINPVTKKTQPTKVTDSEYNPVPGAAVRIDDTGRTIITCPAGYEGIDVIGTIYEEDGTTPVEGADVTVNNVNNTERGKGTTDENGEFKSVVSSKTTGSGGTVTQVNPKTGKTQVTKITDLPGTPIQDVTVTLDGTGKTTVKMPSGYEGTDARVTITDDATPANPEVGLEVLVTNADEKERSSGQTNSQGIHESIVTKKATDGGGTAQPVNPVTKDVQKTTVTDRSGVGVAGADVEINTLGVTVVKLPSGYEAKDIIVKITTRLDAPLADKEVEVWNASATNYRDAGKTNDRGIFNSFVTAGSTDSTGKSEPINPTTGRVQKTYVVRKNDNTPIAGATVSIGSDASNTTTVTLPEGEEGTDVRITVKDENDNPLASRAVIANDFGEKERNRGLTDSNGVYDSMVSQKTVDGSGSAKPINPVTKKVQVIRVTDLSGSKIAVGAGVTIGESQKTIVTMPTGWEHLDALVTILDDDAKTPLSGVQVVVNHSSGEQRSAGATDTAGQHKSIVTSTTTEGGSATVVNPVTKQAQKTTVTVLQTGAAIDGTTVAIDSNGKTIVTVPSAYEIVDVRVLITDESDQPFSDKKAVAVYNEGAASARDEGLTDEKGIFDSLVSTKTTGGSGSVEVIDPSTNNKYTVTVTSNGSAVAGAKVAVENEITVSLPQSVLNSEVKVNVKDEAGNVNGMWVTAKDYSNISRGRKATTNGDAIFVSITSVNTDATGKVQASDPTSGDVFNVTITTKDGSAVNGANVTVDTDKLITVKVPNDYVDSEIKVNVKDKDNNNVQDGQKVEAIDVAKALSRGVKTTQSGDVTFPAIATSETTGTGEAEVTDPDKGTKYLVTVTTKSGAVTGATVSYQNSAVNVLLPASAIADEVTVNVKGFANKNALPGIRVTAKDYNGEFRGTESGKTTNSYGNAIFAPNTSGATGGDGSTDVTDTASGQKIKVTVTANGKGINGVSVTVANDADKKVTVVLPESAVNEVVTVNVSNASTLVGIDGRKVEVLDSDNATRGTKITSNGGNAVFQSSKLIYNVQFSAGTHGRGTVPSTVSNVSYNTTTALFPAASSIYKDGHAFAGWSVDGKVYAAGSVMAGLSTTQGATVTATAIWNPVNTVTTPANGPVVLAAVADKARRVHIYSGQNQVSGAKVSIDANDSLTVTLPSGYEDKDIVVYYHEWDWSKSDAGNGMNSYVNLVGRDAGNASNGAFTSRMNFTVTFNANGGSCATTSLPVVKGRALTSALPTPSRGTRGVFNGWVISGTNTVVNQSTTYSADTTLVATWTEAASNYYIGYKDVAIPSEANLTAAGQFLKSQGTIDEDVSILRAGSSHARYNEVYNEYVNIMNNDNYHLYTTYGTTNPSSANDYAEFRIIHVGNHDNDGSVLTLQTTHVIDVIDWNGNADSMHYNTIAMDTGKISEKFNTEFKNRLVQVQKNMFGDIGYSVASRKIDAFTRPYWAISYSEITGQTLALGNSTTYFGTIDSLTNTNDSSQVQTLGSQYSFYKNKQAQGQLPTVLAGICKLRSGAADMTNYKGWRTRSLGMTNINTSGAAQKTGYVAFGSTPISVPFTDITTLQNSIVNRKSTFGAREKGYDAPMVFF